MVFFLADDENINNLAAQGLLFRILGAEKGHTSLLALSVEDGKNSLKKADEIDWAVIDYKFPDGVGTELVEAIRSRFPLSKIIVHTSARIDDRAKFERTLHGAGADSIAYKGEEADCVSSLEIAINSLINEAVVNSG